MKNGPDKSLLAGKAWRAIRDRFEAANIASAALDARLLAERTFGLDGVGLATGEMNPVQLPMLKKLEAYAKRRLSGEPVARILGVKEFYGLDFKLNGATLVPRPETELLVDLALEECGNFTKPRIADLGTGSGNIGIAVLANCPQASLLAIDLEEKALCQAKENARLHDVEASADFRIGSWLEPIKPDEMFDIIISNPPYIESAQIDGLQKEVREYDPVLALDGGADGLAPYRTIAANAQNQLDKNGAVIVEFGQGQDKDIFKIFAQAGFSSISSHTDLSGIVRAIVVKM